MVINLSASQVFQIIDGRFGRSRSESPVKIRTSDASLETRSSKTSAETKNKMSTPTLDEYGTNLTTLANEVLFWTY
jgi:ATP-dependent Clp protease ATP-binding subunit ClpC